VFRRHTDHSDDPPARGPAAGDRAGRRRTTWLALGAAGVFAAAALPFAVGAVDLDDSGASATEQAERIRSEAVDIDIVSIYNSGALKIDTAARATVAATAAGAQFTIRGSASIPMQKITRPAPDDGDDVPGDDGDVADDVVVVQEAPAFMSIPMGTTVFDSDAVAALMGFEVSAALSAQSLVMSSGTASLRGAQAGDTVTLRSSSGADVDFLIGAVIDDEITGGTELLVSREAAARLDLTRESGAVLWGFESRDVLDAALEAEGLISTRVRIRRSWDPFDPDNTLGMGSTKALLGEFGYRVNSNGSVTQESAWQSSNLPSGRRLLNDSVAIRARCHNVIEPQLRDAFAEIVSVGAGGVFDVDDANIAGGCHVPRFNRLSANSSIGFLSRHSWGMAIDTNTRGSCQGCAPPDFATDAGGCTAVRIMRKHGFAWGGNFLTPDGMHFEYVGEPRDQFAYPSRYCPNIVDEKPGDGVGEPVVTERATIFSDAGLVAE